MTQIADDASLTMLIVSTALGTAVVNGIHCSACDVRRRVGITDD